MSSFLPQVQKRDGRVVPFDLKKIASAIQKAFAATGEGDASLAQELAEVVAMALSRRKGPSKLAAPTKWIPTIEEIQDLVERVLMETGYSKAAKAYILYRDKRSQIRDLVSIRENERSSAPVPKVEGGRGGDSPWSKSKIAAALIQEADIPKETAEQIASRVETKVFDSGLRRITTGLIRELVDNELFEMGLESKRKRQTLIGIPKFDFGRVLKTGILEKNGAPHAVVGDALSAMTGQLVERFALEEVLSQEHADFHRDGMILWQNLGRLDREYSASFRADILWKKGSELTSFESLGLALPKDSHDAEEVAQAVAVWAAYWLRSTTPKVILEGIELWAEHSPQDPSIFLKALKNRLDLLQGEGREILLSLPQGSSLPVAFSSMTKISSAESVTIGPGISRGPNETAALIACGATVSLNLPRIAYGLGRWEDSKFLSSMVELLDEAVSGLEKIAEFQKPVRYTREAASTLGRVSYAVSLEGILEAVRYCREGSFDLEFARTIRTAASDFLRDLSVRSGLSMGLEESSLREAALHFAQLDFERYPQSRDFLQKELIYHNSFELSEFSGERISP